MNLEAMQATLDDLKDKLPIPYVLDAYGFQPTNVTGDRLHYRNPWRDDTDPSLDVFTDQHGNQRAGDFAMGFNGSVLDIIGLQLNTTKVEVMVAEARKLYGLYLDSDWSGPTFVGVDGAERIMDPAVIERVLSGRKIGKSNDIMVELLTNNPGLDYDTIAGDFGVTLQEGRMVIPYPDGQAIRLRFPGGEKTYVKGSTPGLYFAGHQDSMTDSSRDIILVEGETDTWAAHATLGDMFAVGIPGVGHQPGKWLDQFEGRTVTVAFDGDEPGRAGARRWAESLNAFGCTVYVVPMPDGEDVASLSPVDLRRLVSQRRPLVDNPTDMQAYRPGYGFEVTDREGKTSYKYVSNWTLRPVRVLDFDDHTPRAFEVQVVVNGQLFDDQTYILTSEDLSSSSKVHRWASQFSGSWWGTQASHQILRAVIEEQAGFLPLDTATSKPGLVDSTFVYPGGSIGSGRTLLVESSQSPLSSPDSFSIRQTSTNYGTTVERLLAMHDSDVTKPLLAWLAIAPLRSKYEQFPPLFVTGRAGSGKTTLMEEFLGIFSGVRFVTNLTSTTPYALTLTMGSTNAFPTWFDEYRPGARRNTMDMMDQLLRDAYNRAPSRRGGMGEDKSKVTTIETTNPLVVTGEDFADEQSHRDRLVKVFVPRDGKGELPLWDEVDLGLAYDYLLWLTEREHGVGDRPVEAAPVINRDTYKGMDVSERQAYNLAVLDAGWGLLNDYCASRSNGAIVLGPPDWSHMLGTAQAETESDPIQESLQILLEKEGNCKAIFLDDDGTLYVSASQVLMLMERERMRLPFTSARAMTRYLTADLGGQLVRKSSIHSLGQVVRYVALANPWSSDVE